MKNLIHLLAALLLCGPLYAQNTVTGKILTAEGQPLEFANVLLLSPADSSLVSGNITDAAGAYTLTDVAAGDYLLSATMIGYTQFFVPFEVENKKNVAPDLTLAEDAAQLEEVVVTAKKPPFEQKIDRLIVNVKNSITATGSNALEVLKRSPGVRIDGINGSLTLDGKQGVIVEINGKRNRMSGDALVQLLQSMPADNIERIELISTPPASYDAEGTAGIINIVLSRNLDEGVNGSYNLNVGYGERPKYGASLNLNVRKGKFSLFSDLSANQNYLQEDVTINKAIQNGDKLLVTDTYSNRPGFRALYNARLGADYELTDRTTVGVLLSGFRRDWDLDAQTETTITENGTLTERSNLRSLERNDWNHFMYNVNLRHTFADKGKLSFDYDYLDYFNTNPTDYFDVTQNGDGENLRDEEFVSRKENPIRINVWKADYSRPLSEKANIEGGLKATVSDFSNDNLLADIVNGVRIPDPRYTNLIDMDENVYAAYLSADYQFSEKTSAKLGARYEYTDLTLGNPTETLTRRQYGRLFPSAFLSHQFNDNNSVQLSYSERISRPSLNILAPAFFFFSPNVVTAGNPLVQVTFIKQARLSYRFKTVSFTLQASDVDNPLIWGNLNIIADENLTVSRPDNIEDEKSALFFLGFPLKVTAWWESNYETGVGYQQQDLTFAGENIRQTNVYAGLFSNQSFKLKNDLSIELDGYLFTGNNNGLAASPTQGGFNVGMRKQFKNSSSLTLNWEDALNLGSFWTQDYTRPDLNLVFRQTYQQEGSIFRLTWSQSFGNSKLKKAEQRGAASQEESGRVR